jgi:trigger factor
LPPSSLSSAGDSFPRRGIESIFMGIEAPNTEKDALGTRSEVEVVGGCRRRVKASVPADKVRAELDKNYRQLSQSIQLPGFRRGHVPRRLLEARFGEEIEGDVKESLLAESFAEVVEGKDLKVLGSPRFEKVSFSKDSDLTYEVDVEVRPEFELDGYKGIEVEWEGIPLKDEWVDQALENLQVKEAKLVPIGAADAGPEDYFRGTYRLHRDGVLVKTSETVSFVPATGRLEAFAIPDLPERCAAWDRSQESPADPAPGSPLSIDVKVPADYPDEVLRGVDVNLQFQLEEALRRELPPLDEEFAKHRGADSLDALKAMIRDELAKKLERDEETMVDERILEKIADRTAMDLPEGLLEHQKERVRLANEYRLLEEGHPAEEVERMLRVEEGQPDSQTEPIRRALKSFFILDRIADLEKIFVMEREVDERLRHMALLYRAPLEVLRGELQKTGRLDELRTLMRHEKVRKLLRQNAKVVRPGIPTPGIPTPGIPTPGIPTDPAPGPEAAPTGPPPDATPAQAAAGGTSDPAAGAGDPAPGPAERREGGES